MESNYRIYCLIDPNTGFIRYIGLTKYVLDKRLSEHIRDRNKCSTHKNHWIISLFNNNQKPVIKLIEDDLTFEEAIDAEVSYIKILKSLNTNLTNTTNGGEYIKMTDEVKGKISLGNKGKKSPLLIDLTGKKFGKLIVIKRAKNRGKKLLSTAWICNCDCGTKNFETLKTSLIDGKTTSCGCSYGGLNSWASKPVLQLEKGTNKILSAFVCIRTATTLTEMTVSGIYDYIQGRDMYGGGYDWKVVSKEEFEIHNVYHNISDYKYINGKIIQKVIVIFPNGKEQKFESLTHAQKEIGVDRHQISKLLKNGKTHKTTGIKFR